MIAVQLGEHAKLIRGITFKPADKCEPQDEDALVCMRTKNVQTTLDVSDLIAVPSSLVKNPEKLISIGDILVSSANSWNLVGKCCQVQDLQYPSTAGGFISILRTTTDHLDSGYLYRWFSSVEVQRRVRSFGNQTTNISNLDHKRTLKLKIPFPPLAEQKRIARILDAADALRAKRRESLALLDTLLQSTFLDMFGDPVVNPMGWEARPLGEIIKVKSGDGLVAKDMAIDGEFPVYGGNGINGFHDSYMFEEPKIVLGRVGVYCGAVHLTKPKAWVTDNALYVRDVLVPMDTAYLVTALKAANLNQYAGRAAQPLISGSRIYPVSVLVPPLDLQRCFATKVEAVARQKARYLAHLTDLDALFASLQSRAFNGEL